MEENQGIQQPNTGQMNEPPAGPQAEGPEMGGPQGGPDVAPPGQQQPGGPLMSEAAAAQPPVQGAGPEQPPPYGEYETYGATGPGQAPDNPGPAGPTGMNPGYTGSPGMNPGQPGSQGPSNPGNPPYSPGTMGNPGPSAGAFSQPGQAFGPLPGAAQMGTQSGGYPGQGPQAPFPPYQPPHAAPDQPWSQPASGPQGSGPSTGPQMGHMAPGQDTGYMGADAHHIYHDENRFGQMADLVGRLLKGEATPSDMVNGLFSLNFRDDQFWKGAVLGAVAVFILNNDAVHQGLGKLFGGRASETETSSEAEEKTTRKKSK